LITNQAQSHEEDIDLIKTATFKTENAHIDHHHPEFLLSDHPSAFVRYNPLTIVFGSLMWTYQKVVSPQFSSSCLYSPSCSAYSIDLISDYGLVRGVVLSADRLMRCNRLALMDYRSWELDSKIGKIIESTNYYRLDE
jgi:putative membrane protein insertion efficiency factor